MGTIVGAFFFPIGIILGPFAGAFLGEFIAKKDFVTALRSGIGAFLGFLAGTLLKVCFCLYIMIVFVMALL